MKSPKLSEDIDKILLTIMELRDFNFDNSDVYNPKAQLTLFEEICENNNYELLDFFIEFTIVLGAIKHFNNSEY